MTYTKRMIVDNIFLRFQKSGTKSRGVFTFCTAMEILRCTFCPALLPSAREMREIVKNDVTAKRRQYTAKGHKNLLIPHTPLFGLLDACTIAHYKSLEQSIRISITRGFFKNCVLRNVCLELFVPYF